MTIDRDYKGRARLKVSIDIDGVLADFAGTYSYLASQLFDVEPIEQAEMTDWSVSAALGLSDQQFRKVWDSLTHQHWADMEPIPSRDEINTLNRYSKSFLYEIFLLTARREGIRDVTERWLKTHNIRYNQLLMRNDKGVAIQEHGIDIHLEDRPEQVIDARDAGAIVVVRDWLCNRHVEGPGIHRAGDLNEFFRFVKMHRASLDTDPLL